MIRRQAADYAELMPRRDTIRRFHERPFSRHAAEHAAFAADATILPLPLHFLHADYCYAMMLLQALCHSWFTPYYITPLSPHEPPCRRRR